MSRRWVLQNSNAELGLGSCKKLNIYCTRSKWLGYRGWWFGVGDPKGENGGNAIEGDGVGIGEWEEAWLVVWLKAKRGQGDPEPGKKKCNNHKKLICSDCWAETTMWNRVDVGRWRLMPWWKAGEQTGRDDELIETGCVVAAIDQEPIAWRRNDDIVDDNEHTWRDRRVREKHRETPEPSCYTNILSFSFFFWIKQKWI